MNGARSAVLVGFLVAAFPAAVLSAEGIYPGIQHFFTHSSAQCPDIARAGVLAAEQAEYLRSGEFAVSLESVASGTSPYAPAVVPPEWKAAAHAWKEHAAARSVNRVAAAGEDPAGGATVSGIPGTDPVEGICFSSLIYRAFLDYRAKTDQPDLMPVYPYQVRKASAELSARFERVAQRARSIGSTIREAERMGARECSPSELSIAWAELELAGHRAAESGYDIGKAEAAFANAEKAAANLLVRRQLAAGQQFVCYSR